MSMDVLQDRIRKLKCPVIVDFSMKMEHIPAAVRGEKSDAEAYCDYCDALLEALKNSAAGVRFCFDIFETWEIPRRQAPPIHRHTCVVRWWPHRPYPQGAATVWQPS